MTVLSGMSNMNQMEDNLKTMVDMIPLSENEQEVLRKVAAEVLAIPTVPCTGCRYCVDGCPMNILIPDLIRCLNNTKLYGENMRASTFYKRFSAEGSLASTCVACGQCVNVCPQHLDVVEIMKEVAGVFEKK